MAESKYSEPQWKTIARKKRSGDRAVLGIPFERDRDILEWINKTSKRLGLTKSEMARSILRAEMLKEMG